MAAVIYWLSLFATNRDRLVITSKYSSHKAGSYPILSGFIDCTSGMNIVYNTYNINSKTFLPLPRSVNRKGGAQFTYTFWLYLDDVSDENIKNKVLFCRGDMKQYDYKVVDKSTSVILDTGRTNVVKCPLIKFGANYKELVVEFNTTDKFNEKMVIMNNVSEGDSAVRRNAMSLMPHYWVMFTFVFEDNVPINDFENGISIRFYINDTLYQIHKVRSMLKQNNGRMHILPDETKVGIKSARMCDFYYHNYALDDTAIQKLFAKGPSKSRFTTDSNFGTPLYLGASNRIDQTNL